MLAEHIDVVKSSNITKESWKIEILVHLFDCTTNNPMRLLPLVSPSKDLPFLAELLLNNHHFWYFFRCHTVLNNIKYTLAARQLQSASVENFADDFPAFFVDTYISFLTLRKGIRIPISYIYMTGKIMINLWLSPTNYL